jgi:aspartyl-tRNA(Asn)/glutamyl-tRNA(Gln) amidotransferase subunit A
VLLSEVDLLAMPATIRTATSIESAEKDDPTLGLTRLTAPFDLTGQPACSVPCGFTEQGLPVGLQLVGRRFDERTVLRAAHAFETESGVSRRRPPVD